MEQAREVVSDITPTEELLVTNKTASWLNTLYQCGMVSFGKDNEVILNDEIRDLIRGMHAVLAGGKVSLAIEDNGGLLYEQLEEIFQIAHDQANNAYKNREVSDDIILPYGP
jgi:hypothetical protein